MHLGIDLGTSEVKVLLVDGAHTVVRAGCHLSISRPRPGWSEQTPEDWWQGVLQAVDHLRRNHPAELAAVRGIGLSGQMHGATLLAAADRVLRPAILWNDTRATEQCATLSARAPSLHAIGDNLPMPGFTAPKVLWVAEQEPDVFERTASVLLPKDYLRLRLTGDKVSDMSDASGTLWLDVGGRAWSDELLQATGLTLRHMPALVEGSAASGELRREVAEQWGIHHPVLVAGGGGDNAASAVGMGAVTTGDALISLGTPGVVCVVTNHCRAAVDIRVASIRLQR